MKYNSDLIKQITEELQKVPNIRNVCLKVGIDHSTFYRWLTKHVTFHKEVLAALYVGRKKMCDAAEGVIIAGIQRGDRSSATYYLSHNDERYMGPEKALHHQILDYTDLKMLKSEKQPEYTTFENLFDLYEKIEFEYDCQLADHIMKTIVELFCFDDPKLIEIFYSTYAERKNRILAVDAKTKESGLGDVGDKVKKDS